MNKIFTLSLLFSLVAFQAQATGGNIIRFSQNLPLTADLPLSCGDRPKEHLIGHDQNGNRTLDSNEITFRQIQCHDFLMTIGPIPECGPIGGIRREFGTGRTENRPGGAMTRLTPHLRTYTLSNQTRAPLIYCLDMWNQPQI